MEARATLIEHFIWTSHALLRLQQRGLSSAEVEDIVRSGHDERLGNDYGQADWLAVGVTPVGARVEVVYDHPVAGDWATVRIVSAWQVR
jgi:hypothetical protein